LHVAVRKAYFIGLEMRTAAEPASMAMRPSLQMAMP
jgi:hypothetical protein